MKFLNANDWIILNSRSVPEFLATSRFILILYDLAGYSIQAILFTDLNQLYNVLTAA
jgi:hypothetical protein